MWFAIASSVIPIIFLVSRSRPIEMDQLTYAVVMWKFLLVYAAVRLTVRTDREVTITLWVSLIAALLVGAIGILQSLDLLGVRAMLKPLFAPFGYSDVVHSARAGSTVGLPAATADLMVLNLVVALGLRAPQARTGLVCRADGSGTGRRRVLGSRVLKRPGADSRCVVRRRTASSA